jgi:hypothetical protein
MGYCCRIFTPARNRSIRFCEGFSLRRSHTTLVAAHQLGRIGYGCELDPQYVAAALERLALLGLKPELLSS